MTVDDIALETLAVSIFSSEIPFNQYASSWTWDKIEVEERIKYRKLAKAMVEESLKDPETAIADRAAYIEKANVDYYAAKAAMREANKDKLVERLGLDWLTK
jgi:hypothetical protein